MTEGAASDAEVERLREEVAALRAAVARVSAADREALRASEERFRALIEGSSDIISVIDAEGRHTFVSPAVEGILGWSREELMGRSFLELVHPDDRDPRREDFARIAAIPGGTAQATSRFLHKSGSWRLVECRGRNLLHLPAVAGIVVNSRDVTAERQLAEQLARAQKLESLGRLAGGVAHDFNNLLTAILGFAEFLGEGLRTGTASPDDLAELRRAAERARELTGQLLAVARRQAIAPRTVDLNAVVREAEKLLRRVVGEDVDLSVALHPAAPPVVGDPVQLQQVILNLAVNARDAMPEGGRLTLRTLPVTLDAGYAAEHHGAVPGRYVLLAVSDSGVGMTPEVQAHVFEPFFTTKPEGQGTGLGLAIVYGIVNQSGGHVSVESEPRRGSTFKLYFPTAAEEAAPAVAPRPVPGPGPRGHERILVVEDDAMVRDMAVRALRSGGYEVLAAPAASDALEVAARVDGPVDLLVTDVVVPGMNGRRLAEELARRRPGLRVLFMSGHALELPPGPRERGASFLPKPFTPSQLLARVRESLDAT